MERLTSPTVLFEAIYKGAPWRTRVAIPATHEDWPRVLKRLATTDAISLHSDFSEVLQLVDQSQVALAITTLMELSPLDPAAADALALMLARQPTPAPQEWSQSLKSALGLGIRLSHFFDDAGMASTPVSHVRGCKALIAHVNWSKNSDLANELLIESVYRNTFSVFRPLLSPCFKDEAQGTPSSLIYAAIQSGNLRGDVSAWDWVIDHTPSDLIGAGVVQALYLGDVSLARELAELYSGPFPVEQFWQDQEAHRLLNDPDLKEIDLLPGRRHFDRKIEALLDNDRFSQAMRDRFYEACRPMRPRIAEARYQAEDRHRALVHRRNGHVHSRPRA